MRVSRACTRKENASQREQLSQIETTLCVHDYKNSSVLLKISEPTFARSPCIFLYL